MRQIRFSATVDADGPALFDLLVNADAVDEAQVLDWNETLADATTLLYAIDGDPAPFRAGAPETPGVESVDLSETEGGRTFALVRARPEATPVLDTLTAARARTGLVVRKPIVYRDGAIHCRVIGTADALQAATEHTPDAMAVTVETVEPLHGALDRPDAALSARQREAVVTALELGYYETPREATQADVAHELDCAPATAARHLQKAEATVLGAVLDEFGPDV